MSNDFYISSILPYSGIIIKICRAYTNTQSDFEDYYQEVCLQIWKSKDNFKEQSKWRVEAVDKFSKIYKVFYPVSGMLCVLVYLHSPDYNFHSELTNYQEIMNNPETLILFGLPVYYVIGTALFMIFLFFMSEPLYRLDIKLSYGKILKKLDILLEEMEELRK